VAGCDFGAVATANTILENTAIDIPTVFGANSPEAQEVASNPGQAFADFVGIGVHCALGSAVCGASSKTRPDLLPDEPGGYPGFEALFGAKYVNPIISPSGPLRDLDGNVIQDASGHVGFPGFDGMAASVSLAYVAAMQEHGIPITFAYISDAHDNHGTQGTSTLPTDPARPAMSPRRCAYRLRDRQPRPDRPGRPPTRAGRRHPDGDQPVHGGHRAGHCGARRSGGGGDATPGHVRSGADTDLHALRRSELLRLRRSPELQLTLRLRAAAVEPDLRVESRQHPGRDRDDVGRYVGPGVRQLGKVGRVWSDHTDLRPTILTLLGLQDDYKHDGRTVIEPLFDWAVPESLRAHRGTLVLLGASYKQLTAPFGEFGMDTPEASTVALKSGSAGDDSRYTSVESRIESLTNDRNEVAREIRDALDAAEFQRKALNQQQALRLIARAAVLIVRAKALAVSG
jgi:hypothetical protein